ncbi:histidine phosphatase family protein [Nocardioides sp. cx-169]|uniref:histidine phosphatase family protein n=1 Tax=Nocardioides sp. cx-169 TaxID=2899080 RepID=UPI001E33FE6D|nr:histidine phosphatase family protein [Nocardioides sp. cx-169]MCD4533237.1 histidine phosphatase family protein [Nocardioides sp. cx-169]
MGQLLLVRHGQASFGADDYDVLSETGWAQGRVLGARLREQDVAPALVVRGDMRRHRETAEAIAEGGGWRDVPVTVDAGWDEFDHVGLVAAQPDLPPGPLDRRTFQQLFERATARWSAGEAHGFSETYAGFVARVRSSLAAVVAEAGPGRTVVVVSSGGTIAVVAAALTDPEADPATAARVWSRFNTVMVNSSVTRVVVGSTGARLLTFNEHTHLRGDLLTYR